ncbi:MAG: lipid II flippase MurJ [Eubacteriales bacterium]|nr:lipid II flippase MurJ [Eubacteriales bacterium]
MKKKPLLTLLPVMIFTKVMGGMRDVVFLSVFGAGDAAAVYEGTERFVSLFYDITVGAAASSILIPLLCETEVKYGKKYTGEFGAFYMMICEGVCLLSSIIATLINFSIGICGNSMLFLILSARTVVSGFLFTLSAYLNFNSDYLICALSPSFSSAAVMAYLLLGGKNIYLVASLEVSLVFFSCMILTVRSRKKGLFFAGMPKYAGGYMLCAVKRLLPVSLSMQFLPCATLITISLIMKGGQGVIPFSYGCKIFLAGAGTIVFAFSQILYTEVSKSVAKGKISEAKNKGMTTIIYIFAISLAGMILTPTVGRRIMEAVFCRGALSSSECRKISDIFSVLMLSMPAIGVGEAAFRFSSANGKNLVMLISSISALSLFIPLLFGAEVPDVNTLCYIFVISTYLRAVISFIFVFGGRYIVEDNACDNRPKHRGSGGITEESDARI